MGAENPTPIVIDTHPPSSSPLLAPIVRNPSGKLPSHRDGGAMFLSDSGTVRWERPDAHQAHPYKAGDPV
jgi:hypothetical protein